MRKTFRGSAGAGYYMITKRAAGSVSGEEAEYKGRGQIIKALCTELSLKFYPVKSG